MIVFENASLRLSGTLCKRQDLQVRGCRFLIPRSVIKVKRIGFDDKICDFPPLD